MSMSRPEQVNYLTPSAGEYGPLYPWYSSTYLSVPIVSTTIASGSGTALGAGQALGQQWTTDGDPANAGGQTFMWVYADVNLTAGQLVAWADPASDTAAAGSTVQVLNLTTGGLTVNAEVGNWVFVAATGATKLQLRRIIANTANTITVSTVDIYSAQKPKDPNVFDTVATATDVVKIIRPWHVQVCTATKVPVGVALGTVTASTGPGTIIQRAGLGGILGVGSGTALAVNVPAVPSSSGVAIGGGGSANAYTGAGVMLPQVAFSGSSTLLPFLFDLTRN